MNVLFVAAEVAPYVKTGGLADVAGALPVALRHAGHDVRVVMPRYHSLRQQGVPVTGPIGASFLPVGVQAEEQRIWRAAAPKDPCTSWIFPPRSNARPSMANPTTRAGSFSSRVV